MLWPQTLDEFFGSNFEFDHKKVHILVELPQEQTTDTCRFVSTGMPLFTSSTSCLEILKALARQLAHVYEFRSGFLYPDMFDVFLAVSRNQWQIRLKANGEPMTTTALPDLFNASQWAVLERMETWLSFAEAQSPFRSDHDVAALTGVIKVMDRLRLWTGDSEDQNAEANSE